MRMLFQRWTNLFEATVTTSQQEGLILEIGAGHAPSPLSDVVVDKHLFDNTERGGKLKVDRPTVIADGELLPFRDNCFTYSICRQVIEHTQNIERFCEECTRVSAAGHIACPSALREFLFGWPYHNWIITLKDNRLYCCRKTDEKATYGRLFHYFWLHNSFFRRFMYSIPQHIFNIDYYWKGKIEYEIRDHPVLPDLSEDKVVRKLLEQLPTRDGPLHGYGILRLMPDSVILLGRRACNHLVRARRKKYTQKFSLDAILVCPICKGNLSKSRERYVCGPCRREYPIYRGIPILLRERPPQAPFSPPPS